MTIKTGDAVLVENDFSTPEDWPYPAIVVRVDSDANPMAHVKPLSSVVEPTEDGTLPVFVNQCKLLQPATLKATYTDVAGICEHPAYFDPDTRKVYYTTPDDPPSVLDDDAWLDLNGERVELDSVTMIGDLEEQPED